MKPTATVRRFVSLGLICLTSTHMWAHEAESQRAMRWSWEPFAFVPILVTVALYAMGAVRMWRRSGDRLSFWPMISFGFGIAALVIALDSPVHVLGGQLFWVHMTQHELLMLLAAPLLVIGRPLVPFLWALPQQWREKLGGIMKSRYWRRIWMALSSTAAAWMIHAVVLWIWHAPSLFEAALHSEWVHAAQHLCFLASALLFWWTLIHGRHGRLGYGAAVVYVFTTAAHNSVLGALLTFAPRAWYPTYAATTQAWSLTPIEDQQLGGLIMWIPAGTLLLVIGLALMAAWIGESQRRLQYTRLASLIGGTTGAADAH